IFPGVDGACRQLPQPFVHDIAILPNHHHFVWCGHRDQHYRAAMPYYVHVDRTAVRIRHAIDRHREDPAFENRLRALDRGVSVTHSRLEGFDLSPIASRGEEAIRILFSVTPTVGYITI